MRPASRACLTGAALLSLITSAAPAAPISATLAGYDLVKVGDPGNAAQNGYGSVATDFWIGKYEVTIGQYAEFLNAVAKSDPRALWNSNMDSNQNVRGITRSGVDGSYVYTVVGPNGTNPVGAQSAANRPITFVSWFDQARFANWMANGKPIGPAGTTTTDNGAYNLGTGTSGNVVARNAINPNTGAAPTFFLPTENEWYKAAFYSPVKGGPGTPGYYLYGTQSDTAPGNGWNGSTALANKDVANQANYNGGLFAVTGSTNLSSTQNYLTDVGAFANSGSYYGAFDMSGNVWELVASGTGTAIRGGSYRWGVTDIRSSGRFASNTTGESEIIGFRLVSPVPEPATLGLASGGALCAGGLWVMKRRRRAQA